MFIVSAPRFNISSKSFYKAQYGLVDGVLWQIIPYCLQDFLQLVNGIWLGVLTLQWFGGRGAMVLTALAGEWQEYVARHVSDAVVSQCRARVITLSV